MIIRVFRPRVRPGQHEAFEHFLSQTAVPFISSQHGIVAQHVGRPFPAGDEFVYVTVWQDLASLQAFAGDQWQKAVIDPGEEAMLAKTFISHYETLD